MSALPRLEDIEDYRDHPIHESAETNDETATETPPEEPLTPLQELGAEHVLGDTPFIVESEIWHLPVQYRVLNDVELLMCEEEADKNPSPAARMRLWSLYLITLAILTIDGQPPLKEGQEDTMGARFAYLGARPGPFKQRLVAGFLRVMALYNSLLDGDNLPKSPAPRDGAGN